MYELKIGESNPSGQVAGYTVIVAVLDTFPPMQRGTICP